MMEIVLDSNIIIYFSTSKLERLRKWMGNHEPVSSAISQLEVLGYHRITQEEKSFSRRLFSLCRIIAINDLIIEKGIELREQKKMSLGDAIIAATAITQKLPLITANTKDFKHIENLELINPLEV